MTLTCHACGEDYYDPLPIETTEQQARNALRAVLHWYAECPIREIQMANAACGIRFPIDKIEAALTSGKSNS
jgi:hypothetical protein